MLVCKSVKKKMKDKRFAAAVDRETFTSSMEALGMEFGEHVDIIVDGLIKQMRERYTKGYSRKTDASRARSIEVYQIGTGFKG